MRTNGKPQTTIWYDDQNQCIVIIDQTLLPHRFEIIPLITLQDYCCAIRTMQVRGAPLIGVTAAFGLAIALSNDPSINNAADASEKLLATRPTAVNLRWAIERVHSAMGQAPEQQRASIAMQEAKKIRADDILICEAIGNHGLPLIHKLHQHKLQQQNHQNTTLNILTHCNAGWLATVDWGTALAPIYKAHQAGLPIHIWVDETRPRNQGSSLTAWELQQQGIPHTVIADNTGGHLMQHGLVDLCIVGSDRTTASGDVCNKIGTYLKALAAKDNNIPFYVALPSSTIDWTIDHGIEDIPIEQRDAKEITHMTGLDAQGKISEIQLIANSPAANYAFDITPAELVSGLITEHGLYSPNQQSLGKLQQRLRALKTNI
ncbi:MAG: S-methyl-5-thioribose-1-phosphate isomerase [Pseudomonadales bacterium]